MREEHQPSSGCFLSRLVDDEFGEFFHTILTTSSWGISWNITIHERRIPSSIKQYMGTTRQDKMTFFFLINYILISLCYSRFSTYFASASRWRGYYPELLKFNSWNKSQAWDAIRSAIFQTTSLKQVRSDMFVSISPGHKAMDCL